MEVSACDQEHLPSNMSTMRKKASEKEDLPLPVLPQIPTCGEKPMVSLSASRRPHAGLVHVFTFCPGLTCAFTFLSTGFSEAS